MNPWWPELVGQSIRKVGWLEEGLLWLALGPTPQTLVLGLAGKSPWLALVPRPPKSSTAPPWLSNLRRHLQGGRILECERTGNDSMRLRVGARQKLVDVQIALASKRFDVCRENGSRVFTLPRQSAIKVSAHHPQHLQIPPYPVALETGESHLRTWLAAQQENETRKLRRSLQRELARLLRRRDAIEKDIESAAQASPLARQADLLLSHASQYIPGSNMLSVVDWSHREQVQTIDVDPALGPIGSAQRLYTQARKLRRRAEVARARLKLTEEEIADATRELARMDGGAEASVAWRGHRQPDPTVPTLRSLPRGKLPSGARRFTSQSGQPIWVGKGAKENEALLRASKPSDLWLHAKHGAGAHVIVPLAKREQVNPEVLLDAATLAARFSSFRDEAVVEVTYTPRRYVRKPKGSKPGLVTISREKVMVLKRDPVRERRLIADRDRSLRSGQQGSDPTG